MNRYIAEVIAAHVAIENWLNQGEGSADALMRRFSPDFTMIPINGKYTRSPAKRKPRAGRRFLSVCRKRKSSGGTSTRRRSRKRRRPKKEKGPIKRLSLF